MMVRRCCLCLSIALVLWASFFMPWTRVLWDIVDVFVFKLLNSILTCGTWMQYVWTILNHKRMDLVEDLVFLLFFIWSVKAAPPHDRKRVAAWAIVTIVVGGAIIYFVNRSIIPALALFPRKSPSLVVSPCIRVSELIPWDGIKDASSISFPGDHATTLLLFGLFYTSFAPQQASRWAWVYIIVRSAPRLIVGAHWLSDIAVGSLSIALIGAAWIIYTPLGAHLTSWIEGCFNKARLSKVDIR